MSLSTIVSSLAASNGVNGKQTNKTGNSDQNFSTLLSQLLNNNNQTNQTASQQASLLTKDTSLAAAQANNLAANSDFFGGLDITA